jgi:branched-chain amino acid transport system substrate-binding protein
MRKVQRISRAAVFVAAIATVAAGCGDDGETESATTGSNEGTTAPAASDGSGASGADACEGEGTVKIGYVGTLSGPASFLGQAPLEGAELAVEELNGSGDTGFSFEIMAEDDGLDPAKGVAAAQKLVNQDDVDVIIGAAHSGVSQAMVGVTQQAQIPQISPLSALNTLTNPVTPTFFRLWNKDAVIAATLAGFATEHFEKVGLLYETTAFGQGGKDALTAAFEEAGSELVGAEAFDLNAQDLTPQLSKLRSAGAEAIIVQSQGPQAALTAKNLQQLGYDATILGHPGLAQEGFPKLAGGAAEGAIVIDGLDRQKEAAQEFIEAYEAEHGGPPFSFYQATGYDAVHLIVEGLRNVDCDVSRLRDGVEAVEGFQGVVGPEGAEISYGPDDHDGYGEEALLFKEIRDGQLVPFEGD